MSNNVLDKTDVTLLGAGCASLSLASRANELEDYDFTVIDPETHLAQDHIWGFWQMPWLSAAVLISSLTLDSGCLTKLLFTDSEKSASNPFTNSNNCLFVKF